MKQPNATPRLLWIDCLGGLFVGVLTLILYRWLASIHNLSPMLLLFTAAANLGYGCYSLFLATRGKRPLALVNVLAVANMIWAPITLVLIAANWTEISWLGVVHLGGEGLYVGALGLVEWWRRDQLATDGGPNAIIPPASR